MDWLKSSESGVLNLSARFVDRTVVIVGNRLPWLYSTLEAVGYDRLKHYSLVTHERDYPLPCRDALFNDTVGLSSFLFVDEASLTDAILEDSTSGPLTLFLESKFYLSKDATTRLIQSTIPEVVVPGRLGQEGTRFRTTHTIRHADLGGVTNYEGSFSWYTLETVPKGTEETTAIRRDMRFSLKSGSWGLPTASPTDDPQMIYQQPRLVESGALSCFGLYPIGSSSSSKVVTPHHGGTYVIRPFDPEELLRFWDVSETLDKRLLGGVIEDGIEIMCPVPMKVLSHVAAIHTKLVTHPSRARTSVKRDLAQEPWLPTKRRRIESPPPSANDHPVTAPGGDSLEESTKSAIIHRIRLDGENPEGNKKAVKSDDAAPPTFLWDCYTLPHVRVTDPTTGGLLDWERSFMLLRSRMLKQWKRNRWRSAMKYLRRNESKGVATPQTAREAMRDALTRRLPGCTFFEWQSGSIPFFWEWNPEYQDFLHTGIPVWLKRSMNSEKPWKVPQPTPNSEEKPKIESKLQGFIQKDYLRHDADITALISFFVVPKGESDIRVVFDATKSGLNSHLEAPWFPLPTGESLLRSVQRGTWMADNDVGECFYNWRLDESIIPYTGIDLSHYFGSDPAHPPKGTPSQKLRKKWFSWQRPPMGCRPAPYISARCMTWLKEETLGNRFDPDNVFQWESLVVNCPGGSTYQAWMPYVYKRRADGEIGADYAEFVDDRRPCGFSELTCWRAAQRAASVAARHGVQDASRKRRPPSQEPGSWAGYVVHTTDNQVRGLVDQTKWDKTRARLQIIDTSLKERGKMNHKELERYRGFFIYVARVYPAMKPYLKGIHGTLDSWRPTVDSEGWNVRWNKSGRKRKRSDSPGPSVDDEDVNYELPCGFYDDNGDFEPFLQLETAPKEVSFIPRMRSDLDALLALTSTPTPPRRRLRPSSSAGVVYGFGDASGKGFGAALLLPDGTVPYTKGIWDYTVSTECSSNYRELRNLVEAVEESARRGELNDCEVWLFTDNFVSERAFYKGSSKNRDLHSLVLRLRKIEMQIGMSLHIIHISGKRMILSGVDGLSRGDNSTGIMAGHSALSFVPLHLTALERSPSLGEWIRSWSDDPVFLSYDQWLDPHSVRGTYVWCPPPAAARDMLDFMTDSVLKRPSSVHIVVVPRLMTAYWFKVLGKATDVLFTLPCGSSAWPADTLEPLIIALSLPHSDKEPWIYKRSTESTFLQAQLHAMCKSPDSDQVTLLRQLLASAERFRVM